VIKTSPQNELESVEWFNIAIVVLIRVLLFPSENPFCFGVLRTIN
jgi:hypothetical protein